MQTDDHQKPPPIYDFGWWPEIAGIAYTAGLIWFLVSFAQGIL